MFRSGPLSNREASRPDGAGLPARDPGTGIGKGLIHGRTAE